MISDVLAEAIERINKHVEAVYRDDKALLNPDIVRVRDEMVALLIKFNHPQFKPPLSWKDSVQQKLEVEYGEESADYILGIVFAHLDEHKVHPAYLSNDELYKVSEWFHGNAELDDKTLKVKIHQMVMEIIWHRQQDGTIQEN